MQLDGKKVLITGADGFIGSHLTEALVAAGASVRALSLYTSFDSHGWLDTLSPQVLEKVEVVTGDIRDAGMIDDLVSGVDVVFHLAALIAIPFSYRAPELFVQTNILGTLNILQAARRHKTKKVLVTSTSEVYGTAQYVPIDEKHPFQGQSPYSASKIGADRLTESFVRSYGLPAVIVRPFNAYGPRQSTRAVIPTIITQIASGTDHLKLGRTDTIRDFNYVTDIAGAFVLFAESDKTVGEEINIATGVGVTIQEVAEEIMQLMGRSVRIEREEVRLRPSKSEVDRLIGANEKAATLAGWRPAYDLHRGLAETVTWFVEPANLSRYKTGSFTL